MKASIDLFDLLKLLLIESKDQQTSLRALTDNAKSSNLFMVYRMLAKKWPVHMNTYQDCQHPAMMHAIAYSFSTKKYPQEMYTKSKSETIALPIVPYADYDDLVLTLFMRKNGLEDTKSLEMVYALNKEHMLNELESIKAMLQNEKSF